MTAPAGVRPTQTTPEFPHTFSPMSIGNVELRNRTVVPAMDSGMLEVDGSVGQYALDYYGARADGGFGMVIVEIAAVQKIGVGMPNEPNIWDDSALPGLTKLAERINAGGAVSAIQLHHAGRETNSALTGEQPVSTSSVPCPVNRETPRELTTEEVYELVSDYGDAALRAKRAGFSMIEIHAAHGYMGGQFLSPRSNKRIDEFGGDIYGRTYFLKLVREDVRKKCGDDYPVIIRISMTEDRIGGPDQNSTLLQAMLLESYGYDALHISAGSYGSWETIVPPPSWGHGWNLDGAKRVREAVDIPVIAVGRINEPHLVEMALSKDYADFVALGRPSIADPAFPNKMKEGRLLDIVPCISCTQRCMTFNDPTTLDEGDFGVSCMFNPFSNNRAEMRPVPAEEPKKVMIVGAGPGGLEAAHVAAGRGHDVTLYDAGPRNEAGGQLRIAAYPPFKQELVRPIRHWLHKIDQTGVKQEWGVTVTNELIREVEPDVLIIATGSEPVTPPIPGADGENVVQAVDVLLGEPVAGKIMVVGGGETGVETAEYATDYCDEIVLVDMLPSIAEEMYLTVRDAFIKRLKTLPIDVMTETRVKEFLPDGAIVERNGEEIRIEGCSKIVLATGVKTAQVLEGAEALVPQVHRIGDAKEARNAVSAIWEGANVALNV